MNNFQSVKIEIYIPEQYIESLRDELNKVYAGHVGNYDNCISVTVVTGYWRPLDGSSPYDGEIGKISSGDERKVEVNILREYVADALRVIRKIHPYEEPVINIIPLINHIFEKGK